MGANRQNPPDYVSQEYAAQLRRLLQSSCQHSVCADDVVAVGAPSPRYRPGRRRQYETGRAAVWFKEKGVDGETEEPRQETTSRQSHSDLLILRLLPPMAGQCLTTGRAAGASAVSEGIGIQTLFCQSPVGNAPPWAAEATSILPAGPTACQRLASPVGSRQATGPRRRARPGRVAGDGQPARLGRLLGLLKRDERLREETDTKALATLEALRRAPAGHWRAARNWCKSLWASITVAAIPHGLLHQGKKPK